MERYEEKTMVIIKKPNGSKFFLRKGGAVSSLLTPGCLFDRPAAWAESRQYTETHGNEDVIVFRTVGENAGFLGKTPVEILSAKTKALLRFCGKQKSKIKEKSEREPKKKKAPATFEPGGLFDSLGEYRESENETGQSRDNRPYDIF